MNYLQKYQKQLGLNPDGILGPKTAAAMMADLGITDKLFFAHMMGQIDHESQGYTASRENMNYSVNGLLDTFAKYYTHVIKHDNGKSERVPIPGLAQKHARKPIVIANYVYANRNGNGNEASGDGWNYRGIFGLQLTGKDNITGYMIHIGVKPDTDPNKLLEDPRNYFDSGKYWFNTNKVDRLCVSTSTECIVEVGGRVNGGTIGKKERIVATRKMFKTLELA